MHIYFITRGIKHEVDQFIKELSCQYLPYDNKEGKAILQTRLSPIQLWDVSFPKEHRDAMLTTLFKDGQGKPINKKHSKWAAILRKILGVKKIPAYRTDKKLAPVHKHMEVVGIGIKDDAHNKIGKEMI